MDMTRNKDLGTWGEQQAQKYLNQHGVEILAGNVHTPYGEFDLIGRDEGALVFFEVKTRRTKTFGYPEQSIRGKKMEHMINSAVYYLQSNPEITSDWRIDVLSIEKPANQEIKVTWFKYAISA